MKLKIPYLPLFLLTGLLLTAPPPHECNISVSPAYGADKPVDLPEEQVTADAEEDKMLLSPGTVTVIKPQEMKGEQKNLPELLKQVPGLHIIELKGRGAYTTASVRGSTASQVAVYVDGVLMNLGSESAVDLSTIPVEHVERIEVYRGYIPARFGGASMGGVINIITMKPDGSGKGVLSVGGGSYGRFRANASYSAKLGDGNMFVGFSRDQANGEFNYLNTNNEYNPNDNYEAKRKNNSYQNTDALFKWQNDDWVIEGSWKRNDRDLPYPVTNAIDAETKLPSDLVWHTSPKQVTDQWNFSAARRQQIGDLDLGVRVEYLHQDKKYDDDTLGDAVLGYAGTSYKHNKYTTERIGMALDGSMPLGDRQLVEFLFNYYNERLKTTGDVVANFNGMDTHKRDAWNFQIQDTISLNKNKDNVWLTPIIRWNSADSRTEISGGVALNYKFDEHWSAKATYGNYNRAPNMYEMYGDGAFVIANTGLEWESGTQWDIGVTWKGEILKGKTEATLTYFGSHVDDLIEYFVINPRYGRYENVADAHIKGVELEGSIKWDDWEIYGAATWMDAINKTAGSEYGMRIANRPEYEGFVRITRNNLLKNKALSLFAEGRYIGNNFYDRLQEVKQDDLFTVGFGARYQIRDDLKLVVGVDDIFDEAPDVLFLATGYGPERTMWYPLQGRTFYATLIWTF